MSKKKKIIIIAVSAFAAFIIIYGAALAISSYFTSKDDDLGLKLSVSNASRKGVTVTLERDDPGDDTVVYLGKVNFLFKRGLFDWIPMDMRGVVETAEAIYVEDGYSKSWNIDFVKKYEKKLSPGVYRIVKIMEYEDENGESHNVFLKVNFLVLF